MVRSKSTWVQFSSADPIPPSLPSLFFLNSIFFSVNRHGEGRKENSSFFFLSFLGPIPSSNPIPFFFSLILVKEKAKGSKANVKQVKTNERKSRKWETHISFKLNRSIWSFIHLNPPCQRKKWAQRSLIFTRYVFSLPQQVCKLSQLPFPIPLQLSTRSNPVLSRHETLQRNNSTPYIHRGKSTLQQFLPFQQRHLNNALPYSIEANSILNHREENSIYYTAK